MRLSTVSSEDLLSPAAQELALILDHYGVPRTQAAAELMGRYVDRARWFRFEWALLAAVFSLVVSSIWYDGRVGFNSFPLLTDIPLVVMMGWLGGIVRTELFRLRPRSQSRRQAILAPRYPESLGSVALFRTCRTVLSVTIFISILNPAIPSLDLHPLLFGFLAVLASLVVMLSEACRRAIAHRARPALPADVAVADAVVRQIATRALGLGATGVTLCCLSYELTVLATGTDGGVGKALGLAGAGCLIGAFLLAWAARTLVRVPPLRSWRQLRRRAPSETHSG